MAVLHHCVHQTHMKHHAIIILVMANNYIINDKITIQYSSNKKRCKVKFLKCIYNNNNNKKQLLVL